ncbi:MAG: hypothetical protein HYS13_17860 [Planctomycetia bacterium]|nr:hypothetical protein [Planctomycetia bacterium]
MSDNRPQSNAPPRRRPWWSPHLSTWTIGAAVCSVIALFNIMPDPYGDPSRNALQWGWPRVWYRIPAYKSELLWNPGALWLDIGVGALIVGVVGTVVELRRRRRGRFWQFRLTDIFGLVFLAGLACIGPLQWYRETQGTWALREAVAASDQPLDVMFVGRDVPCDWLWEVLFVPDDWRPERIEALYISLEPTSSAVATERQTWTDSIPRLDSLKSLRVYGVRLEKRDVANVAALPRLEGLQLDECGLNDDAIGPIANLHRLRSLSLNGNPELTGAGLQRLAGLESLRALALLECPNIRGKDVVALDGLHRLQVLHLGAARGQFSQPLGDDDLHAISKMQSLSALYLNGSPNVTDEGLVHLAHLENLRFLMLDGCSITDLGLEHLHGLKKLKGFSFRGTKVTRDGEMKLRAAIAESRSHGR